MVEVEGISEDLKRLESPVQSSPSMAKPCSLGTTDEVQKVFNQFDKNGDGRISRDELTDVLRALGSDADVAEVARIMAEIDTDGDGFIDLAEFTKFNCAAASNKELRDAFDLYDVDRNGLISAKELHAVLKRLGDKSSLSDCSRMIRSVDADGDGSVNFEEFKKMMSRS